MPKQLVFNEEARRALTRGIEAVSKSVKTTLGPKGRNVALGKKFGAPTVTHDGVTVAKEIELPDPFENMGAQLLKEAATKTNDIAGDGTTTATVLAEAIVFEGMRNVAAGANPMIMQPGAGQGHRGRGAGDQGHGHRGQGAGGDRQHRRHLRQRPRDRAAHRRGDGQGRQGRGDHGRGEPGHPVRGGVRGGDAVRSGLHLPLLRLQRRPHDRRAGGAPSSSSPRRRSPRCRTCCPGAGEDGPARARRRSS